MKRRHLILTLGGASAGAMTIGSGAFSSAQAERGVSVSVVDDDHALVGYDSPSDEADGKAVTDGERVDLVTVENRFADGAELSIEDVTLEVIPDDGEYPKVTEVTYDDGTFGSGDSETIEGTIECAGSGERATVELTVRVAGEGVSAELFGDTETRRFEIVCYDVTTYSASGGVGVEGVEFKGNGNAEISSPDEGEVDVQIYYVDGGGVAVTDDKNVSVGENLRGQTSLGGKTIAGVHVKGIDGVFVHPQFDADDCGVTPGGGGGENNGNGNDNGNGVSGSTVTETRGSEDAFGGCLPDDY
ncbi:hypothetical protein [Halorubrum tibetense]|uniref:SipW-cognate class signal peptide n=1 Tax=Halorubrum tibetense TaxID=175631 RepID=A0ABD5SEK7_9EURY